MYLRRGSALNPAGGAAYSTPSDPLAGGGGGSLPLPTLGLSSPPPKNMGSVRAIKIAARGSALLKRLKNTDRHKYANHTGLYHVIWLVLTTVFKKAKNSVVSNGIRMKCGRNVLYLNTHRLTESDFRFDITLSRW